MDSSELYNPASGSNGALAFTANAGVTTHMNTARDGHTATLLCDANVQCNGNVLVAGGRTLINGLPTYLASSELFHPNTQA